MTHRASDKEDDVERVRRERRNDRARGGRRVPWRATKGDRVNDVVGGGERRMERQENGDGVRLHGVSLTGTRVPVLQAGW